MSNTKIDTLTETTLAKWARMDLWDLEEFKKLCCGLDPDVVTTDRKISLELEYIEDQIDRAINAHVLNYIALGNYLIEVEYQFKPADVIRWATERFPKFPKRFLDLLPPPASIEVKENAVLQKPEIKDPAPQSSVYDVLRVLLEMTHDSRELESLQNGDRDAFEDLQGKLRLHGVNVSTKSLRSYLKKAYKK